ncbi:MAG: hypothetical protein ABI831_12370, partial [Betaproteobacteria bacterium]
MSDSADLCQAFFDSAESAVFVIETATGTIAAASLKAALETGYSPDEMRGLGIDRLFRQQEDAPPLIGGAGGSERGDPGCHAAQLVRKNGATLGIDFSIVRFKWKEAGYYVLIARESHGPVDGVDVRNTALPEREEFPTIIGRSVKIREVCQRIGSLANSDVTVLLQGE